VQDSVMKFLVKLWKLLYLLAFSRALRGGDSYYVNSIFFAWWWGFRVDDEKVVSLFCF